MNSLGSGTKGYGKNRYYRRLNTDDDDQDPLSNAAAKPPSGKRWKPQRPSPRPKVVKVAPPSSTAPTSSSTASATPNSASSVGQGAASGPPANRRRRRFWRIRMAPRLTILRRVTSLPVRLLRRLQRGYVRMMIKFAGAMGGVAHEISGYSLPRPAQKEYDDKVLVEIYRALVAQGHALAVTGAATEPHGVPASRLVPSS